MAGELLVAGDVHEAVRLVTEVMRERAHHGGLRDAGEPDQQHRLAALQRAEQQTKLPSPSNHRIGDVMRQAGDHGDAAAIMLLTVSL